MSSKTGPGSHWLARLAVLALDLGTYGGICALLHRSEDLIVMVPLALGIVIYSHDRPFRWRSPSLLVAGVLGASLVAWALVAAAAYGGSLECPAARSPWPLLIAPVPGHLLARLVRSVLPAIEVRLVPTPGTWRLARRALGASPARRFVVKADATMEVRPPAGPREQRHLVLETPAGPLPLFPEGPEAGMGAAVKRSFDLAGSTLLLLPGIPAILVTAVLVKLTSQGPAFYSQDRVTSGERVFRIHKLRSMVENAEPDGRPIWPEQDDPRITPLGRILRRYWLDELPQLFDVLRGHLSLIGPRPERPAFVKAFSERLSKYPLRHQVTAGMTGLAQIMGFIGNTSLEGRLRWDLRYVTQWSPALDVKILFLTGLRMLRRKALEGMESGTP